MSVKAHVSWMLRHVLGAVPATLVGSTILAYRLLFFFVQSVCTEAGMYALRERRVHVTHEDFEMSVAKVRISGYLSLWSTAKVG